MNIDEELFYSVFNPKLKGLIRELFQRRNEEVPAHLIHSNPSVRRDSIELLLSSGLAIEEEGYITLQTEFCNFLENIFDINETVVISEIEELAKEIHQKSLNYEQRSSEDGKLTDARQIRRLIMRLETVIRSVQKDIRRLAEREIRFESDVNMKIQQLTEYSEKTENFKKAVERCERFMDSSEGFAVSHNSLVLSKRKRLRRTIEGSSYAILNLARFILDYIHKVKADQGYLNKLTLLNDLIERQEVRIKTDIEIVLNDFDVKVLAMAEPIRTSLPPELWSSENLEQKFITLAENQDMISYSGEEIPIIEDEDAESLPIFIPDLHSISEAFAQTKEIGLMEFLINYPFDLPNDDRRPDYLLETFCMFISSSQGEQLYYEDKPARVELGGSIYLHIQAYSTPGAGRQLGKYPDHLLYPTSL